MGARACVRVNLGLSDKHFFLLNYPAGLSSSSPSLSPSPYL